MRFFSVFAGAGASRSSEDDGKYADAGVTGRGEDGGEFADAGVSGSFGGV